MAEAITDPDQIAKLEASAKSPVTDPDSIAQLERSARRELPVIDPYPLIPDAGRGSIGHDVLVQFPQGFNEGLDNAYNLPNHVVNFIARKLGYEPPITPVRLATRFNTGEEPETLAGKYAHAAGEFAGASALPVGAASGTANALRYPGRYLADWMAGSTAGGTTQEAAREHNPLQDAKVSIPYLGDIPLGPAWEAGAGAVGALAGPAAIIGALKGANALYGGVKTLGGQGSSDAEVALDRQANALADAKTDAHALLDRSVPRPIDPNAFQPHLTPDPSPSLLQRGVTRDDISDMIARRIAGESAAQIAQSHNTNAQTVSAYVKRYRNALAPELDVNQRDIANMIVRANNGEQPTQIAQDYKIHPTSVQNYLNQAEEMESTPKNLIDLAKEGRGVGGAAPVTRLGKGASGLSPDSEANAMLESRQRNQAGRVTDLIQKATSDEELARRIAQVESDFSASRPNPSTPMTPAEQATLDANKQQATSVFERERTQGREMEAAQDDLRDRLKAESEQNYKLLHGQPDVPIDDTLADIFTHPKARQAWQDAIERAHAQGQPLPKADEIAQNFGLQSKPGVGLTKEGTPSPPGAGRTDTANYNLQQMSLQDQIDSALQAGDIPRANELYQKRLGRQEQWETKTTGQSPDYNRQPMEVPVRALDYFQQALREQAESGAPGASTARELRTRLIDTLDPKNASAQNPPRVLNFRDTMSAYREGKTADEAFEVGRKMASENANAAREARRDYDKTLTPTQQHFARLGYSRGLMDRVKPDQQNSAAPFMNDQDRAMMRHVFPTKADDLINGLESENITTGTRNDLLRGSQTADKSIAQNKILAGLNTAWDIATLQPGTWIRNLGTRLSYQIGERQAGEIMRRMATTDPTDRLQNLLDLADRAKSASERHAYVQAIADMRRQMRGPMTTGAAVNAFSDHDEGPRTHQFYLESPNRNALANPYQKLLDEADQGANATAESPY